MPTSFGSIGKIHNSVSQDVVFSCFIGNSFVKIYDVSLPKLAYVSNKFYFLLDQKLLELNNQNVVYSIHGFTAKFGTTISQQVRLYDQETGQFIKELDSSVIGEFTFEHLYSDKKYTLTTRDKDSILESVILDSINAKSV